MFKIVLVTVFFGLVAALPIDQIAEIRSLQNIPADAEGNFAYAYETSNGIAVEESGNIAGVAGGVQYISPEGIPIQLVYTADQDGFHPSGNHLPTPPPIPEPILRSLAYNAAHPQQEERVRFI